ncbi:PEP-CTERM sorting domain-containing protein [Cellvibrio sp.]|uniref:PEP-CTERM sorting domain-containing protein n=1 Tax=Cellvibrio sp. TaxID=1965322 RepID=UPI00396481C6
MKAIINAIAFCFAAGVSTFSQAALVWDWQFEVADLGVKSPTSVVQGRAIISNDVTSTESINPLSNFRFGGTGLGSPVLDGNIFNWVQNETGFGNQEPFPWTTFNDQLFNLTLSPGESKVLDFIWAKSALPQGFESGNYTLKASIGMCLDGCRDLIQNSREYKERTLSWSVAKTATVPEPSSLLLFSAAFGMLLWSRLRKTPYAN